MKGKIEPFMPGIHLVAGLEKEKREAPNTVRKIPSGFYLHGLASNEWLSAAVCTRLTKEQSYHEAADGGVQVLFDGYLSDILYSRAGDDWKNKPARAISTLYGEFGKETFSLLRGSFTILIVDQRKKRALLISDRSGSRPSFYYGRKDELRVAPTVYALYESSGCLPTVDDASVVEFLLTGAYRGRYTLFRELYRLPQAGILEIDEQGNRQISRYWRLRFKPQEASEEELISRCDEVLRQAVTRTLTAVPNAVLGLSGGLDSRVVLGYIRDSGAREIPVTCYWERGTKGDDSEVAKGLAKKLGLPIISYEFDMGEFIETAEFAVMQADCGAEVIDSAPLARLWGKLGEQFTGFINGDECFGWHGLISSKRAAFTEIRWYRLQQASRLADLLHREARRELEKKIDQRLNELADEGGVMSPNDLKDWLYYEERLGKMLNAFTASRLMDLEPLRPLIDEDVIDFVSSVPEKWRDDKLLLRKTFQKKFSELDKFPYSSRDVLPIADSFRKRFVADTDLQKFFREHLIDGLSSTLRELLDEGRLWETFFALAKEKPLPSLKGDYLAWTPGLWRLRKHPENRVAPFAIILRLTQLNIYLKSLVGR